jgi:hypothetical protein
MFFDTAKKIRSSNFSVAEWPPKIVNEIYWAMKKNSIDVSTSIID